MFHLDAKQWNALVFVLTPCKMCKVILQACYFSAASLTLGKHSTFPVRNFLHFFSVYKSLSVTCSSIILSFAYQLLMFMDLKNASSCSRRYLILLDVSKDIARLLQVSTDFSFSQINLYVEKAQIVTLRWTIWSRFRSTKVTLWSLTQNLFWNTNTSISVMLLDTHALSISKLIVTVDAKWGRSNFVACTSINPKFFNAFGSTPSLTCLFVSTATITLLFCTKIPVINCTKS